MSSGFGEYERVTVEITGLAAMLRTVSPEVLKKATASAMNKTTDQARTWVSSEIRKVYNLTTANLRGRLEVSFRASPENLQTIIIARGRGFNLYEFAAKQSGVRVMRAGPRKSNDYYTVRTKKGYPGGVSVLVKFSSGRKDVITDPKAFIAVLKNGVRAVLSRVGKKRLPVHFHYGPGLATMFAAKPIYEGTKKIVLEKFGPIFQHEFEYYKAQVSG